MAPKFEISEDHAGKFRFHLKAPNGEIIAASQGYATKASAEKTSQEFRCQAAAVFWLWLWLCDQAVASL
jgi:uncharacterized protein YegP (UPF0339 family)